MKLLSLFSLFAFTCNPANAVPNYGATNSIIQCEDKVVSQIDVITVQGETVNAEALKKKLKTQERAPFSQVEFDQDLKLITRENDRVEHSFELISGQLFITLRVWPKPTVTEIEFEGNEFLKTGALKTKLGVKEGEKLDRTALFKGVNDVKELYVRKGCYEPQVDTSIKVDPKTNGAKITIKIVEGRSGHVGNIDFIGFTSKEKRAILEKINTKTHKPVLSWFTGDGTYSDEIVEQDRLVINDYLHNEGYACAQVDIKISQKNKRKKMRLIVEANKGPKYHIADLSISGNELFTDEEVYKYIMIKEGDIYSPENVRKGIENLKDAYGSKGYIEAAIPYSSTLASDGRHLYSISVDIDEGREFKIGMITIVGNVTTKDHVILRESLLFPGSQFNNLRLKATQRRLENIGYFKTVNVYAVQSTDSIALGDNYRDVYIEVEEAATGSAGASAGFSSADSVTFSLDLSESNFNYKGLFQLFSEDGGLSALRGGGEYVHLRANFGKKQRQYSLSWMNPYIFDTMWRFGFDISESHSELESNDYDIDATTFTTYASYPINPLWTYSMRYRFKWSRENLSNKGKRELDRDETKADGLISSVGTSLGFDSTDSAWRPRRGFRSVFDAEFAGVGGNNTWLKFGYYNCYYTSPWRRGTFKARIDFRAIQPLFDKRNIDDIPLSERFFLGGDTAVRGFKDYKLGPKIHNKKFDNIAEAKEKNPFFDEALNGRGKTDEPLGGVSSVNFTLEYLHALVPMVDAFAFCDAGSLSRKTWQFGMIQYSAGFGLRLQLMGQVPIILGYAFPFNGRDAIKESYTVLEPRKDPTDPSKIIQVPVTQYRNLEYRDQKRRFFFSLGAQF